MSKYTFECQIAGCESPLDGKPSYASFLCSQCRRQICLHPHLRWRKIDGQFNYVCVECLPAFDQAHKAQKKEREKVMNNPYNLTDEQLAAHSAQVTEEKRERAAQRMDQEIMRSLIKEHARPASAKLAALRAHASERNLDMALIERAESWLATFQQECGEPWREPERVFYDDVEPEIEFNWYSARNLSIGVTSSTVDYSAWDDAGTYDKDGTVSTTQERMYLWQWLREA